MQLDWDSGIEGADRVELLIEFLDALFDQVDDANNILSKEKLDAIHDYVRSKRNKMSTEERKKRLKRFETNNIKKALNKTKAEEPKGVDVTAGMGGCIVCS